MTDTPREPFDRYDVASILDKFPTDVDAAAILGASRKLIRDARERGAFGVPASVSQRTKTRRKKLSPNACNPSRPLVSFVTRKPATERTRNGHEMNALKMVRDSLLDVAVEMEREIRTNPARADRCGVQIELDGVRAEIAELDADIAELTGWARNSDPRHRAAYRAANA